MNNQNGTETLTHWKKLTHPDYLGAYALNPGQDMVLTIKTAAVEVVTGADGKKQECMVIHFMEPGVKPMICNKTNAKLITKVHKTPYIEQWKGKRIALYSSQVSAFGTTTDALRVRDFVPPDDKIDTTAAIMKLEACTTYEDVKKTYLSLSNPEQAAKDVKDAVARLKNTLTSPVK